jgi:hypothetical protein
VIAYVHVSKLKIENPIGTHGLHPANVESPDCKATRQVDQHGVCVAPEVVVAMRWSRVDQGADRPITERPNENAPQGWGDNPVGRGGRLPFAAQPKMRQ